MSILCRVLAVILIVHSTGLAGAEEERKPQAVSPRDKVIKLFNGKDFTGLYTFLKDHGVNNDPNDAFRVDDGVIHVSGEGRGYLATENEYRDYHLTVEFKWGERTDGSGYVRNAGVLVHGTGPDGSHRSGIWMASLEVQLAQGCEGDLIVIRGKDKLGEPIAVDMAYEVRIASRRRGTSVARGSASKVHRDVRQAGDARPAHRWASAVVAIDTRLAGIDRGRFGDRRFRRASVR